MAYKEVFTCDVCEAQRQKSNHWFIGSISQHHLMLETFTVSGAKDGLNNTFLFCGEACVSKWISANLASLHRSTVKPLASVAEDEGHS